MPDALVRERAGEQQEPERDQREDAVDLVERLEVVDDDLRRGDPEQGEPAEPQPLVVAQEAEHDGGEARGAPERREQHLRRLAGLELAGRGEVDDRDRRQVDRARRAGERQHPAKRLRRAARRDERGGRRHGDRQRGAREVVDPVAKRERRRLDPERVRGGERDEAGRRHAVE